MKIVFIGISGLIGSRVVTQLRQRGHARLGAITFSDWLSSPAGQR
jgi:nucleoside-diphosphate-sugar epimerase